MENLLLTKRNQSIDILRGLTMILMVFVNDLWSVGGVPHYLEHTEAFDDGMGLADFVFPMFLFTMGMSIPYALERRYAKGYSGESTLGHILSRTLALVLMGVFTVNSEGDFASALGYGKNLYRVLMVAAFFMIWNVYPAGMKAKKWLQVSGVMILAFLALTYRTPEGGYFSSRWWGILGIIGWTYCFCAVTYLLARKKPARIFFIWLGLIAVNMLLTVQRGGGRIIDGPSLIGDVAKALQLLNGAYAIMATGGMLLSLAERKMETQPLRFRLHSMLYSLVLLIAAMVSHHWWITSKLLGTLPFCLYVSALTVAVYIFLRTLEAYDKTAWFRFLSPSGTATLTVYMMPYLLYSLTGFFGLYAYDCLTGIPGLLKCALFSLVCVGLTGLLSKAGIKLKV